MLAWSLLPQDIPSAWAFVLLGGLSVVLLSATKAGFGGSMGLLSVPLMVYACGGKTMLATGIMLPLLIAADYFSMLSWLGRWDWRVVAMLLPGTAVGIAVGGAMLWGFQQLGDNRGGETANATLMLGIGLIALVFVAVRTVQSLRRSQRAFRPTTRQAVAVGLAAGVTSTLAHAAGPIVTMYLLPQQIHKSRYAASTVLFYWMCNQLKLVPYFALGMINVPSLGASAALLPAAAGGVALGIFLHRRLGQRSFTGVVYVLLALAGSHLIIEATRRLWG